MLLDTKIIIITGAGRGIGRSVAIAFAKEGAKLGLTARSMDELNETKELALKAAPNATISVATADITKFSEVDAAFATFQQELGAFNSVIANAGAALKAVTHECDPDQFANVLDVNVTGVFNTFKASYARLAKDDKKKKARFVITGSAAYPNGMAKFAAYTASKWAVVGLQKALALEYSAEHVNFVTLLPTMVDTRLLRGGKAGDGNKPPTVMDASELDPYFLFLVSDDANKISDETIDINDFQQVRKLIADAPADKKASWDAFKAYLEETQPSIYKGLKKLKALAEFLLIKA